MTTSIAPAHRKPTRFVRRLLWIAGSALLAGVLAGGVSVAYWQSSDASEPAGAVADSLPQGATPTASLDDPTTVAVSFSRATTAGGRDVTSYTISRYDAPGDATPVKTFVCSWPSGSSLSCTDTVPGGTWYYTDTPRIAGSGWTGAESAKSAAVISDVTPPTIVVTSITPGPNANGYNNSSPVMVNLSATDEPDGSGVASVTYKVGAGTPVTVNASTAAAPVSGNGTHTVTFSATDNAGNASAPQSQTVKIDTTGPVLSGLAVPTWVNDSTKAAVPVSGSVTETNGSTVTVVATDHNAVTITRTVTVAAGASGWNTSLDLTGLADGTIDYAVTDTDDAGNTSTPPLTASSVKDTAVPSTPTMTDPGTNLRGTVTLQSTNVSDNLGGAGVGSVTYEVKPSSGSTWSTACVATTSPWSCGFATTSVADGNYDVRAVTTDKAGNKTTSGSVTSRRIDNTPPTVTLADPGANLRGTVTLSASAADGGSGLNGVTIQRSPAGAGTWTTVCTKSIAPYTCSLDTTSLSDGLYDLRATATDNAGNATTSLIANRRVDNTNPTASSSVSPAPNGGGWNNSTVTVTITASDAGSGVHKVYYTTNGTTPSTGSAVYNGPITLTADGSNPVRYLAVDNAGNLATGSTATIKIDRTVPTASITCPTGSSVSKTAWQNCTGGSGGFTGTAGDSGTGSSGLASVEVQARNTTDGTYWSGSAWVATATWLSPSGSTSWSYALNQNKLSSSNQYTLSVRATDNAGNTFTSSTSFTYSG